MQNQFQANCYPLLIGSLPLENTVGQIGFKITDRWLFLTPLEKILEFHDPLEDFAVLERLESGGGNEKHSLVARWLHT